ncbi:exodeoxyribonuclease V subunit gamma [Glaciecola sp. SC05]|uniref:exodeoxyribonuclease V subunit gamma n=1 Tax=Glaciecola sp. SC05 TaxID=1987355 RepID=UPI0035270F48
MLYLYPSNKLEHLSHLLHGVMRHNAQHPLQKRVLLVQHTGMQHWLSMDLARISGITMQLDFPLPTRFVWETCRDILGDDAVPQQSTFKREVMVWRILDIITAEAFNTSPYAASLHQFWNSTDPKQTHLQQFRFAQQLADLFEQYLVFRPDWLLAWDADSDIDITLDDEFSQICYAWQKWFWRALVAQFPMHPVVLQKRAMAQLASKQDSLPKHIYLFAINTMPPGYMDFFNALAEFTDIHWFHLNPSVDYWAEAKSDRAIARQLRTNTMQQWVDEDDTHPLLRNFGKQGKDLLVQLLNSQSMEISAFEPPDIDHSGELSLLQQLQSDILKGGAEPDLDAHAFTANSSIHVHACYHEIRELQVLKDFILEQLEQDPSLGLDDILVMCPAIEEYSPFISGVFETRDSQHLAISISDRQPIESQPTIAAFMQLLALPEARFSVEQVISLLDTPAVMSKFALSVTDIKYCRAWIENVRISFALDTEHKAKLVSADAVSIKYTWEWGIERLLVATMISEEQQMANGVAIAHTIEGQAGNTLGKLIAFLSSLRGLVIALQQARSIQQWRDTFDDVIQQFFTASSDDSFAFLLIEQALSALNENADLASFGEPVSIEIARQALKQGLTVPETKSRFMCGKVTFCSMMPMRSIPFKVVAILGLNQKSFPRQSYPSELDLIAKSMPRVGDRSRRNDDRYLFLEALVSARSHLYLSYQYRNIQSNAQREPSLVLKELIEHCRKYYCESCLQLIEHPLHPFSQQNFVSVPGWHGSFAGSWARHAAWLQAPLKNNHQRAEQYHVSANIYDIAVNDLVAFYEQPLNYFAKECLQLRFEATAISEYSQPFDIEPLQKYGFRQRLFNQLSQPVELNFAEGAQAQQNHLLNAAMQAGGDLPELPDIDTYIEIQTSDIKKLVAFLHEDCSLQTLSGQVAYAINDNLNSNSLPSINISVTSASEQQSLQAGAISFFCQIDANQGMVFPVFKEAPKLKDRLQAWISYVLLVNYAADNPDDERLAAFNENRPLCASIVSVKHSYGKPKLTQETLPLLDAERAKIVLSDMLAWFKAGNQQPLFVNPKLVDDLVNFESADQASVDMSFMRTWNSQAEQKGKHIPYDALALNPYFAYFYAGVPPLTAALLQIYFDVYVPMLVEPVSEEATDSDAAISQEPKHD